MNRCHLEQTLPIPERLKPEIWPITAYNLFSTSNSSIKQTFLLIEIAVLPLNR